MRVRHQKPRQELRVAFVEKHALLGETFAAAVRAVCTPCPVLVTPGTTTGDIARSVLAVEPDIAVLHLDAAIPDRDLPIERLHQSGIVTVVLTDRRDDRRFGTFVERGAGAALSAGIGLRRLVDVIVRVSSREAPTDPSELDRLRAAARCPGTVAAGVDDAHAVDRLSVREAEVLRQLMAGLAPAQIARRGYVSEATVRTQVRSILAKLGVGSQLAAVALAYRSGWQPAVVEPVHS